MLNLAFWIYLFLIQFLLTFIAKMSLSGVISVFDAWSTNKNAVSNQITKLIIILQKS